LERGRFAADAAYREESLKLFETSRPWDLVFNPLYSREFNAEQVVAAAPAKVRIGVSGDQSNISAERMRLSDQSYAALVPVDNSVTRHELHRNNEILSLLGSPDDAVTLTVPITEQDRQFADEFIAGYGLGNFGLVFPGTKGGARSIKYWGSDNYAALVDRLKKETGKEILLMVGPFGEENLLAEISVGARSCPTPLLGQFAFWQSAALVERAAFYVGSDTSVAHIAAAMKVPTFVLLGGGHFGRFFPYPEGSSVTCLTHKLECFNCYWKCSQRYNKCIADISVQEVVSAVAGSQAVPAFVEQGIVTHFHIGKQHGSKPRVDLVIPQDLHCWHLADAVALTLKASGHLHRVFRGSVQGNSAFFKYLRTGGQADLLLAMGGDHHLWYLHDTEDKRELWQRYRGQRVCNTFESTRDSLYKKYIPRVKTALQTFTHFLYSDEVDQQIFERAGLPSAWWPQAADHHLFGQRSEFSSRTPKAFFCGKVWSEYPMRRALMDALEKANLCSVAFPLLPGELVEKYNQHMFAFNPPGVLGGFNVRAYEAMSSGSLLLQFLPSARPRNQGLFEHGKHLLYFNGTSIDAARQAIEWAKGHLDSAAQIASRGRDEVLQHHTVEIRLGQMLAWVLDGKTPQYPEYGVNADAVSQVQQARYVNDAYLFENRLIPNPEINNEFATLQFLAYHALIPRLNEQAEHLVGERREVEAIRMLKHALETDSSPDQANNNLGVLFWQRGEHCKALEYFEAALLENPAYRPAVINYGEALVLTGAVQNAQTVYAAYLARHPDPGVRALINQNNELLSGANVCHS
jgi:ADP-heptose:LPS heptosyltransferase/tetratricopeptide (TPR) repeat protein